MHYQELYIFPDPETPRHALREKVFAALHLAFIEAEKALSGEAEITAVRFGISFPNYHAALHELDYTLRVFAPSGSDFDALNLSQSLKKVKDYLRIGEVLGCPQTSQFACFKRKQVKSGLARLARRQVKRGNFPNEEIAIKELKKKDRIDQTQLPYLYVTTSSTGKHRIPLFIQKTEAEAPGNGRAFTTYGLSKDNRAKEEIENNVGKPNYSTVPVF